MSLRWFALSALLLAALVPSATRAQSLPAQPSGLSLLEPEEKSWGYALLAGPLGVNLIFHLVARTTVSGWEYGSNFETIGNAFTKPWVWDEDAFSTNQLGHPYQGSLSFSAARGYGLDFWESFLVAALASTVWEVAGESTRPSVNDAITTPVGGAFLGEILFRYANRALDALEPGFWREASAIGLAPTYGLSRLLFDDRFRPPSELNAQPFALELSASFDSKGNSIESRADERVEKNGFGDFTLRLRSMNGFPGGDWTFRRPFDYALLDASVTFIEGGALGAKFLPSLGMRGMLLGSTVGGVGTGGILGLMGAFDFQSAGSAFQVSSTSLGFGNALQLKLDDNLAAQWHGYGGLGFGTGAQGFVHEGKREYRFGGVGVALLDMALIWAERGVLRVGVRQYGIIDSWEPRRAEDRHELITFSHAELIVRIYGNHSVGLEADKAWRKAAYPNTDARYYQYDKVFLSYIYVTDTAFGMGR